MGRIDEHARREALHGTGLLDTPRDASFDRLTRLASTVLAAPVALVSLVDADRQFFKSCIGLPEPLATSRRTLLSHSLCRHAVESGEPLIVGDAREHPLGESDPALADHGVIAYAGIPLRTSDGHVIGTLCVIDHVPRSWDDRDVAVLTDIAAAAMTEIELRREVAARAAAERASASAAVENARFYRQAREEIEERRCVEEELRESRRALATLFGNLPGAAYRCANDEAFTIELVSEGILALTGHAAAEILSAPRPSFAELIHPDDRARLWQGVQEAIAADRPFQLTYRMLHRDGGIRWVHEQGRAIHGADGAVVALEGFIADVTERRAAEAALQQGEERYRAFFQHSPLPMWVYDPATLRFQAVNDAAVEHYGYSREEFLAMAITDIRPEADVAPLLQYIAAGLGKSSRQFATRHRRKDGTLLHTEVSSQELVVDGRASRLVVANDVTHRVEAQAARAESEAQFRAMFEDAGVGMALVGLDGHALRTNAALQRLLGLDDPTIRRMAINDVVHPDDRARAEALFLELVAGRRSQYEVEQRFLRADGTIAWGRLGTSLVRDAAGAPRFIVGMVQDITEAHLAEQARRDSEQRYRQLVELSPDGIVVHRDGRVRFANRGAALLAGVEGAEALLGRAVLDFVHPDHHDDARSRIAEVAQGRPITVAEQRWVRLDGTTRAVEVTSMPFMLEDGPAIQTIFRDVTERRELEEQLRQSQKMDAVGRLAGGIAHDFNNLLTVISAHAEFLLQDLDSADARHQDAQQIRVAAGRAAGLTRQLLAFSRKQILTPRPLALNAVVTDIRPMLDRLIGEDVVIETRLDPALGAVMMDAGQIEQVLVNLVVNSRDAMPDGGRIVIRTANVRMDEASAASHVATGEHSTVPAGDYVQLTVIDDGIGMAPGVRMRVFEPFFTTKPTGKGTGLGLSTVYGIIRQSGGHIAVRSALGKGTSFTIHLPRVEEAADATAGDTPRWSSPGGTETILLVEDEDAVRALAQRTLARQGYHVLEARDGEEALALAAQRVEPIHLVLTDVVMPKLSGRALAERLRDLRPAIAVMYMSGYTDDEIVRRGILTSETPFLQKPFGPSDLLRQVRAVLDEARAR